MSDGDGNLDIVVPDDVGLTTNLSILRGGGDGTFALAEQLPVRPGGSFVINDRVVIGDFTSDGAPDILLPNQSSVALFTNECTAITAPTQIESPAAGAASNVATGDLDGDGDTDAVVVLDAAAPSAGPTDGMIQIFLNEGGMLVGQPPVPVGAAPSGVAVGLLDDDRALDVAVSNFGDDTVTVLFNDGNGTGTFRRPLTLDAGPQPIDVAIGDLTEDGAADIAVGSAANATVRVLENSGAGTFTLLGDFAAGGPILSIEPEDVDGDRCLDMVGTLQSAGGVAGPRRGGAAFVLLNPPDSEDLDRPVTYGVGAAPVDLTVADLDGDGAPEIVTANRDDDTLSILLNGGRGIYAPGQQLETSASPLSVEAVDINDDGAPDLAVALEGSSIEIFLQSVTLAGGPAFGEPISIPIGAAPRFMATADFNGDGSADLVTANTDGATGTGGSVTVLSDFDDGPPCPADTDGSGAVNRFDLVTVLNAWATDGANGADVTGDGHVDIDDLIMVVVEWGTCG